MSANDKARVMMEAKGFRLVGTGWDDSSWFWIESMEKDCLGEPKWDRVTSASDLQAFLTSDIYRALVTLLQFGARMP